MSEEKHTFKSGFIAVMGKPNVGKSTLVNTIVGRKVSIISSKPQTTRHRILGVKTDKDYQMVFVDTPGIHYPKHELGRYMEKTYISEYQTADLVLLLVDCTHPPTNEDKKAAQIIFKDGKPAVPIFLVINKIDIPPQDKIEKNSELYKKMGKFDHIFYISALKGEGIDKLLDEILKYLPEGPPYFPSEMVSDQSPELTAAEIVREKILLKTRQEVPHSVFVHTEEMRKGKKGDDLYFYIIIYVERESQKGIIIGKNGERLKAIGKMAREELELIMGKKIYLDLWVKVKKDWKDRKDLLRAWGYDV